MIESKFSVIITAHNRAKKIIAAIESVFIQTHKNWEIVIVDDGSTDNTAEAIDLFCSQQGIGLIKGDDVFKVGFTAQTIRYIKHQKNEERVVAMNTAHFHATGDWVAWLDADDQYVPVYLETFNLAINQFPDYPLFNCGKIQYHASRPYGGAQNDPKYFDRYTIYEAYKFEHEDDHEKHFETGKLGAGQFVFKRDLLLKALPNGMMPEAHNCYKFADIAGIPGYNSKTRTLGNPWGQDYFIIYKLTRIAQAKQIPVPLYLHYTR